MLSLEILGLENFALLTVEATIQCFDTVGWVI